MTLLNNIICIYTHYIKYIKINLNILIINKKMISFTDNDILNKN